MAEQRGKEKARKREEQMDEDSTSSEDEDGAGPAEMDEDEDDEDGEELDISFDSIAVSKDDFRRLTPLLGKLYQGIPTHVGSLADVIIEQPNIGGVVKVSNTAVMTYLLRLSFR
eukprot:m.47538 g.47538  ORF g.47538 m.47538 type:complete len:114 (+) comp10511_c0_seq2:50-391(+)